MSDGRRERKKRATRAGLALAALELSLEHGPDEVTIEHIAARADVTPRTFFNHFPSKEDAILYAVNNELHIAAERRNPDRWLDVLRARPDDEPIMRSMRVTTRMNAEATYPDFATTASIWRMLTAAPALLSERTVGWGERNGAAFVAAIAERLAARGDLDTDPEFLAGCVLAAVRVATVRALANPDSIDWTRFYDMQDELLAQLEAGFGPDGDTR